MKVIHICNLGTPEYSSWQNITSPKELISITDVQNCVILLNVHLTWNETLASDDIGFDIAIDIRAKHMIKAPIVFYSPHSITHFERKGLNKKKYLILYGRGSGYIESPFDEADLVKLTNSIAPLSDTSLYDVISMLTNIKGIVIDRLNHDLKYNKAGSLITVLEYITPYLSAYPQLLIELSLNFDRLKEKIEEKDEEAFLLIKHHLIDKCEYYLTENNRLQESPKQGKFKILVLDDSPEDLHIIVNNLSHRFNIIALSNATEALAILNDDLANEIVAVMVDWRLYSNQTKTYWQELQGYEILEKTSFSGFRALFALTSQADFFVHQIRNLMCAHFTLFKKENVIDTGQWELLGDMILEQCREVIELISSLPKSANWVNEKNKNKQPCKSLKSQYIERWNSADREAYISHIEAISDTMWDYLNEFSDIGYKGVVSLKLKFGIEIPTFAPLLEPVLIYRRIWMALWYSKVLKSEASLTQEKINEHWHWIYSTMFNAGHYKFNVNSPTQEAYKLCIQVMDLQRGEILPEERAWLMKKAIL